MIKEKKNLIKKKNKKNKNGIKYSNNIRKITQNKKDKLFINQKKIFN